LFCTPAHFNKHNVTYSKLGTIDINMTTSWCYCFPRYNPANILYRPDIGPILDSISARHRLPISAQCRMCNSATHRADIGNRYRLPTCSRYCADIHRLSLFLAKTRFSWLLKPSANKIGKRKTGECITFNKFIYTNKFKATF